MQSDIMIITLSVKSEYINHFEEWLRQTATIASTFDGYQGINILKPIEGGKDYILAVRFTDEICRKKWEHSKERERQTVTLKPMIEGEPFIRYEQGIDFWFSNSGISTNTPSPKWKMALVAWCAAFPLILLLSTLLKIAVPGLPIFFRMVLLSMCMIISMTFLVMPILTKLLREWLYSNTDHGS